MPQQNIQIKLLERSPLNVRKTDSKAALEELKASILAHGLMQNLVVIPAKKGKHHVIAGGRRLAALQALQAEKKLPADHAVPCQIADAEQAIEMSLAENVVRQAMHPADQYEAFAALVDAGATVEQVAQRFGTKKKTVLQLLRLGRVAPELLQAYRDEKLDLDCLIAFAITDDRKRQLKVYKGLQGWQKGNANAIRDILTEKMVEADDKLVKFVGLKTYEAAGGTVRPDLFGDEVYLENPEMLNALVSEKLKLVEQELLAEGWGWVMVKPDREWADTSDCGRIKPQPTKAPKKLLDEYEAAKAEEKRLWDSIDDADDDERDTLYDQHSAAEEKREQIEEKLEAYAAFDTEQMKVAGCYVSINHDGELSIDKGLVRKADQKKLAGDKSGNDESEKKEKPVYSRPLFDDLQAIRTHAARLEIAKHRDIAFDLMVFTAALGFFTVTVFTGPNVHLQEQSVRVKVGDVSKLEKQWQTLRNSLPLAWLKEDSEADKFVVFQKLSREQKLDILAFCTAGSLRPHSFLPSGMPKPSAYEAALAQTGGNVAEYWRPSMYDFLNRIGTSQLQSIAREVMGDDWMSSHTKDKKSELVRRMDTAFANPSKDGDADKLRNWLPLGMAFTAPAEAAKGKKPKKAA